MIDKATPILKNRAFLICTRIVVGIAWLTGMEPAIGQILPPAPYKALPVGTVLDYGKFNCTIERNAPFTHSCRGSDGARANFFAKLVPFGRIPEGGYGSRMHAIYCSAPVATANSDSFVSPNIDSIGLSADDRRALQELWPLETGKEVSFRRNFRPLDGRARSTIRVVGTKIAAVLGQSRPVYELKGRTTNVNCLWGSPRGDVIIGFDETWLYAPDLGAVVHYDLKWRDSIDVGQDFSYDLKSINLSSAPAVANLPGRTPNTPLPTAPSPVSPSPYGLKKTSTGTGFIVSSQGHVLTNAHVVSGCGELRVTGASSARKVATAKQIDLALLKVSPSGPNAATFRGGRGVRTGEDVIVAGYPLHGLLSSELSVTKGIVSTLAGPGDDRRIIQITAPVQPGNSGGPTLDTSGNVVGVVVARLSAIKLARATGALPQNVNFAISEGAARAFLDGHNVPYDIMRSDAPIPTADIAEKAKEYTMLIECWK